MVAFLTSLPTWELIRFLGLLAYLLLFAGVSLGMLYSMPVWKGKGKAALYKCHSTVTVAGTFCGILHAMILVIDTYMPFSWLEILIPFRAAYKPLWNGIGTLAAYGTLILILTTDLRNRMPHKLWRMIHIGSYPVFLAALIHGLGVGSDTKHPAVYLMYVLSFGIMVLLLIVRLFFGRKRDRAYLAHRG
ncbi:ferric reductase [Brevibacillus sp. SYP-B805]|uniref:ferric reductase-like transmembrane domain-containing protein n=1 Tax=Brevibacillus sp. SYP-B805 TaxID=1578199 RepID=UPI0013ECFA8E|nr:ferric reductase-like transmembrane domain-containing protein [Brevibacillus sp. SYP-B805]NGQ95912.1 ferric reductase [Brevibacillus sp. SYP-B805]